MRQRRKGVHEWNREEAIALQRLFDALGLVTREMGRRTPLRRLALLMAVAANPDITVASAAAKAKAVEKTARTDVLALGAVDRLGAPGLKFISQRWDSSGPHDVLTYSITPRGRSFLERLGAAVDGA